MPNSRQRAGESKNAKPTTRRDLSQLKRSACYASHTDHLLYTRATQLTQLLGQDAVYDLLPVFG